MPSDEPIRTHFTTRRAFVAAAGFGGLSLYGLWAGYGAAPGPLALLGLEGDHAGAVTPDHAGDHGGGHAAVNTGTADAGGAGAAGGAHGGHGAAGGGPDPEAFRRMTDAFIERYRLGDGTVHPRRLPAPALPGQDPHAGHAAHAAAGDGMAMAAPMADGPIEVPMVAGRWYYLPAALRLDAGEAYRFRMLAVDTSHGASIQFGRGGRMARLHPGREAQLELSFPQPGRYFMYCTVYCGAAHDLMQARIEVV
ncbi:hypothetical protein BURK1_00515 [Burkholderiales bacterium]|nr:hypothetical protein BURK1_00515 [Burkholderiales bacterium]